MKRSIISLCIFAIVTAGVCLTELYYSDYISGKIKDASEKAKQDLTVQSIEEIKDIVKSGVTPVFYKESIIERFDKETSDLEIMLGHEDYKGALLSLERIKIYADSLKNCGIF